MQTRFKPLKRFKAAGAQVGKVKNAIKNRWYTRWEENQRGSLSEEARLRENKNAIWKNDRTYHRHYNPFFSQVLSGFFNAGNEMSIAEAFAIVAKENGSGTKKHPFTIIDDGAGKGLALAELKEEMKKYGVETKTIALTLAPNEHLESARKSGKINQVISGPAEFFLPKKSVDAIISLAGSIQHTIPVLTKDHFLKFAYSLKRGGVLMMSFHINFHYPPNHPARKNTKQYLQGLVNSLNKRGFEARVGLNEKEWSFEKENSPYPKYTPANAPPYMLIVRRTKG